MPQALVLCDECEEELSPAVVNYSRKVFARDLCRACQTTARPLPPPEGVSDRELNTRFNMIKGRIAEGLVEELLRCLGYQVSRFGMENTVPELKGQLKGRAKVTTLVRTMPDFLVQRAGEAPFLVEVKFRANEAFSIKDLVAGYPYDDVLFVIVSKRHIKCITYEELKQGAAVEAGDKRYLGYHDRFKQHKDTIIKFCEFAVTFFQGVPEPHK